MNIWTILIAIVIFFFIIIIHELGHFTAARIFKMKVYEFSLGMGPTLLKKVGKKTTYSLKLLPIGGSVQLGEDDEDNNDPEAFRNKPVWQRMITILAGAIMNLVLGLILCIIIVSISSVIVSREIAQFDQNAASSDKLMVGDEMLKINNMSILTASDISYQMANTESKIADENYASFDFLVRRSGENVLLEDVRFDAVPKEGGGKSIVFDFKVHGKEKTFGGVIDEAFRQSVSMSRLVLLSLRDVIVGTYGINDFSGPVGVVDAIGKVAAIGWDQVLVLFALITINVGIFNLLPIPALDGARFIFFIIELFRRKPVKVEVEGMIHFIGFAALMLFMLVVTFNDIRRIFFI